MAETWYWRTGTGAACGPGTQRPLSETAGGAAATQDIATEHTWNRTEASARTIQAGNWSVLADITTASGGGAPNKVTIVAERRNSSCVVQQTIGTVQVQMSAGTTQEYTFDFGDPGAVVFAANDILTCRIIRSAGSRAQTLRFDNAATTDADTRLIHPGSSQQFQESFAAVAVGVALLSTITSFIVSPFNAVATGLAALTTSFVSQVTFGAVAVGLAALTTSFVLQAAFMTVAVGVALLGTTGLFVRAFNAVAAGVSEFTRSVNFLAGFNAVASGLASLVDRVQFSAVFAAEAAGIAARQAAFIISAAFNAVATSIGNFFADFIPGGGMPLTDAQQYRTDYLAFLAAKPGRNVYSGKMRTYARALGRLYASVRASSLDTLAISAGKADWDGSASGGTVSAMRLEVSKGPLGVEDTTAPFAQVDVTLPFQAGRVFTPDFRAIARFDDHAVVFSPAVSSLVDNEAPSASMTAPADQAVVSGATVTVSASASDGAGSGIATVQFEIDRGAGFVNLGAPDATAPYSITWDTTLESDGPVSLRALSTDAQGNAATSVPITVTVDNS